MSPLVRKEIRLLVPFWALAMLLAVLPSLLMPVQGYLQGVEPVIFQAFSFGLILLSLAPFGQEFSMGMFSSMLAQPIDRRRIWKLKISFITIAGLLVLIAFALSIYSRLGANAIEVMLHLGSANHFIPEQFAALNWRTEEFWPACGQALLLLAITVSGGLWATLLFRQMGAALWFVILIPAGLYVAAGAVCQSLPVGTAHLITDAVLVIYSALGFVWAQGMFTRAQDSQWLGETVALLSLTPAKPRAETTVRRRKGVLRALVRKELQSHQISLLVGFGLVVLHVCTLVFRRFETLPKNSELRFVVGAIPFLWLFVPWLIGSVTVAEERKLGTMESQLCLPVTRRFQFGVKFAIALLLGLAFGGILPSLLEWLGTRFHISSEFIGVINQDVYSKYVRPNPFDIREYLDVYQGIVWMCLGALAITVLSIFSSTLSRNTLHALGGAILFGFGFVVLFAWINNGSAAHDYFFWKGPLIFLIGVPVSIITIIWLSFSNYKKLYVGGNVWFRTFFILSATLAFTGIATAFIDQRPWELVVPREPFHGPRRLSGPVRPAIIFPAGKLIALLPDGQLWTATQYRWQKVGKDLQFTLPDGNVTDSKMPIPTGGVFVPGSNWVAFAAGNPSFNMDVIALRSDGTLWNILSRTNGSYFRHWQDFLSQEPALHRVGADSDWKTVVSVLTGFVAVKTNGTLWGWGRNEEGQLGTNYPKFVDAPVRISADSDWDTIFSDRSSGAMFMKRDGSLWRSVSAGENAGVKQVSVNLKGADWLTVVGVSGGHLIIRKDGSLWARGFRTKRLFGINNPDWNRWEFFRVGSDSDWTEISGFPPDLIAIKGGRLLKNGTTLFANSLGRPSKYSDWLAANMYFYQLVALAADGTLCAWQYSPADETLASALGPTRHPAWSLNILTSSNK